MAFFTKYQDITWWLNRHLVLMSTKQNLMISAGEAIAANELEIDSAAEIRIGSDISFIKIGRAHV